MWHGAERQKRSATAGVRESGQVARGAIKKNFKGQRLNPVEEARVRKKKPETFMKARTPQKQVKLFF